MPVENIELINMDNFKHPNIPLVFLCKCVKEEVVSNCGKLYYLQGIRSGTLKIMSPDPEQSDYAVEYHKNCEGFAEDLSSELKNDFDLILSPPSRFDYAEIYRNSIVRKNPSVINITKCFSRDNKVLSGSGIDVNSLIESIDFNYNNDLSIFTNAIIVDDIVSTKTTLTGIIQILENYGFDTNSRISAACPLFIK